MERRLGNYSDRLAAERRNYADQTEVHDLPAINGYWGWTHLRPIAEQFGFSSAEELFLIHLERAHFDSQGEPAVFASLGAGNCDTEVQLAEQLRTRGISDFEIHCLDVNEEMLGRGRAAAQAAGLEREVRPMLVDVNGWRPDRPYDGVIANQALHHLVELESLFDAISTALQPHGRFVASDMIGRNGHQRWPEARAVVDEFWAELPDEYTYNLQLDRRERTFQDWDCSADSFEAIRSQDILPALIDRFGFELFVGFANVIDPFVDRSFGPHFDPDRSWDRDFIDRVHARDEQEMLSGHITPTHMFAVMRKPPFEGETRHRGRLTPAASIRLP